MLGGRWALLSAVSPEHSHSMDCIVGLVGAGHEEKVTMVVHLELLGSSLKCIERRGTYARHFASTSSARAAPNLILGTSTCAPGEVLLAAVVGH